MALVRSDAVTDFGQFTGLRAQARSGDDTAVVRKAAQQFEALFTQQMLKSMRATKLGDDVLGGGQTEFYQDIFDQQMSVHLSSGKGLGLADLLVTQLRAGQGAASPAATGAGSATPNPQGLSLTPPAAAPFALPTARSSFPAAVSGGLGAAAPGRLSRAYAQNGDATVAAAPAPSRRERVSDAKTAREQFVREVWPHAERAGRELGVSPRVLVAQAALETGWGKHTIRDAAGQPSFNFFGIKADKRWEGTNVKTTTTEFVAGQARREDARFRAYGSAGESFDNYVNFLKSNPRYQNALDHGGNMQHFAQGLQKAGYATDPAYAQKILKIASGRSMNAALAAAGTYSV